MHVEYTMRVQITADKYMHSIYMDNSKLHMTTILSWHVSKHFHETPHKQIHQWCYKIASVNIPVGERVLYFGYDLKMNSCFCFVLFRNAKLHAGNGFVTSFQNASSVKEWYFLQPNFVTLREITCRPILEKCHSFIHSHSLYVLKYSKASKYMEPIIAVIL